MLRHARASSRSQLETLTPSALPSGTLRLGVEVSALRDTGTAGPCPDLPVRQDPQVERFPAPVMI